MLGQQAIDAKSNEIKAIPLLLERLALKGALVTIDAIGTQTEIAEMIIERGGDYCLALKENRPVLYGDVERFFADPPPAAVTTFKTTDGDHERLEERVHSVCHDVAWLFSDRRYAGEPAFPHLAMIGMIESRTERGGKVEHERRYYLSSAKLDADTFARVVRAHWGVGNRLHWVLDVVFHDDLARLRSGHGPENMAIVKHMALNRMRHQGLPPASRCGARRPPGTPPTSRGPHGCRVKSFKRFRCALTAIRDARRRRGRASWRVFGTRHVG